MKDVNKIILIGRLGRDPELKETKNGLSMVRFSLATSRRAKTENTDGTHSYKDETDWHRIVTFGRTADLCAKYLKQGETIYLEGKVQIKKYLNNRNEERTSFEVIAEDVKFLSGKKPEPEPVGHEELAEIA